MNYMDKIKQNCGLSSVQITNDVNDVRMPVHV